MATPQRDSLADLLSTPGVAPARDAATAGFKFQQTMLRVKEPSRSLDFYTRVLGMTLIAKLPFPTMKFTLYFLAYTPQGGVPDDPQDRIEACMGRCGVPRRSACMQVSVCMCEL
jgi:lactoylglutathione lyase